MVRDDTDAALPKVPLDGLLSEFRAALLAEIEAARRSASSVVELLNGRRIAQVGPMFQYVFTLQYALNLPGDAPADLAIPGRSPLEATVIAVDGMMVVLAVEADLDEFVPFARLQSNMTLLLRKLIGRIESHASLPNPAGGRLLGGQFRGSPAPLDIAGLDLNDQQFEAAASCLGRDTTFIWGPPGTGKTQTIGAVGALLYRNRRSLLVVSHTNIAVDQAILRIAKLLPEADLQAGKILRVGEPRDQQLLGRPELLLATHVKSRSEELTARLQQLTQEEVDQTARVLDIQYQMAVAEWSEHAESDIENMATELIGIHELEAEGRNLTDAIIQMESRNDWWAQAIRDAQRADGSARGVRDLQEAFDTAEVESNELHEALDRAVTWLALAHVATSQADPVLDLRSLSVDLPGFAEALAALEESLAQKKTLGDGLETNRQELSQLRAKHDESASVGALLRMWRRLPKPEDLEAAMATLESTIGALTARQQQWETLAEEAMSRCIRALDLERQRLDGLVVENAVRLAAVRAELQSRQAELQAFEEAYGAMPEKVLADATQYTRELRQLHARRRGVDRRRASRRLALDADLQECLELLAQWRLTEFAAPQIGEVMLQMLSAAQIRASQMVARVNLPELRALRDQLNGKITQLQEAIKAIMQALQQVESILIAEAMIVATTLTRAYLRDTIYQRRFDTVLLDEASMAPIPALWVAAGLADANVIVVGDFHQLPPIVLATHALAQKWLGRDVFQAAGLRDQYEVGNAPPHFVALRRQYRMHPAISSIPNTLIYHMLEDDPSTEQETDLESWYRLGWSHDTPVLLVDTGPLDAWVTSVARGEQVSRLNFLSATVCVDLAEQLLRDDRTLLDPGAERRILIVCPYRPHAQLLEILLKSQGLESDVAGGTAHSFQGSEADVVILDLVNDEPHWRVSMFMPERDETTIRLINVAITRARRRLMVVGDFGYIRAQSKKAFLGSKFVPYLLDHYPLVQADQLVPPGVMQRAESAQSAISGGSVEAPPKRLVVTQQHFFPLLMEDVAHAQHRVVMYSPFMTQHRVGELATCIRAAVERGVGIYVVTKALGDRAARELATYTEIENILHRWGVVVIHKRRMHEKLVVIDGGILWSGSLNPLSFSDTQEIMERRVSREVVVDFSKVLFLDDLLKPYDEADTDCPICGSELVATEGNREPFFWRCVVDRCYTRNVDDPPLIDGALNCRQCGGALEFGSWGGRPSWRCVSNRHHHQPFAWTHLKLPRMRERIPAEELAGLEVSRASLRPFGRRATSQALVNRNRVSR